MSRAATAGRRGLPAPAGVAAPNDRRFRRSDLRPDRRRQIGSALRRVVRWGVPGVLGSAACVWIAHMAAASPFFAVRHVTIRGNTRLSTGDVQALLTGLPGRNILRVDFAQYRRRVLDSPWVADVTFARELPSTIAVQVTERAPMATARLGNRLYLVDDRGIIIDESGPQYHDLDLPIVDGLLPGAGTGSAAPADRVRLTAALLGALSARPEWRRRLSQVDVTNAHDAVVLFDTAPAWLHLGDTAFVDRLGTYFELAPTLRERFQDVDYVDLRCGERVFVHARRQLADSPAVRVQ
jgi:cell division septal protein FtsQ